MDLGMVMDHGRGSLSIMRSQRGGCTPGSWVMKTMTNHRSLEDSDLPALHEHTISAFNSECHLCARALSCFPFLFAEACLILLTTLNEDKARVCNNRLKLNFKQIIC